MTRAPLLLLTLAAPAHAATCADRALATQQRWGEQRPDNADENFTTGRGSFAGHVDGTSGDARYGARVWGNSRTSAGALLATTREVLAWGACKWGLDPDITYARAVVESTWHMSTVGDGGHSHGIMQINDLYHDTVYPQSARSTPFNVDYAGAWQRACLDGDFTWLGARYLASTGTDRVWGCVGAWYSGLWYDPASRRYIGRTRGELAARRWERPGF